MTARLSRQSVFNQLIVIGSCLRDGAAVLRWWEMHDVD